MSLWLLAAGAVAPSAGQETASPAAGACAEVGPPALWWTFDEPHPLEASIGAITVQTSARGKPVVMAGRVGTGVELGRSEDGIVIGSLGEGLSGDLTVETWLRTDRASGSSEILRLASRGHGILVVGLNAGRPVVQLEDGARRTGNAVLSDGRWHHLGAVVTRGDTALVQVFVDGDPVPLSLEEASAATGAPGSSIGGTGDTGFVGALDELSIHAGAIPRTDLVAIWAAGKAGKCREEGA